MKKRLNRRAALLVLSLLVLCAAFQANADTTVTSGGLLHFTSQGDFQSAFPGLPREDFEESTVPDGAITYFPAPLDSATDAAGAFAAGDILPGLTIRNLNPPGDPDLAMFVEGVGHHNGNTSKIVGMTYSAEALSIEFSSPVNAVGMDLLLWTGGGDTTISIYGASGLLDTLSPIIGTTPLFLGIYSLQPITQITVDATGDSEMVDNIRFGAVTPDVTFYTDRDAFENAHPGLTVEDFEESPVASGSFVGFPEPLNSSTDVPGAFSAGDIAAGLNVKTMSTADPTTALGVIGDHFLSSMANASKMVCSIQGGDNLTVYYSSMSAYAFGMDLLPAAPSGTANQTASVFVLGITGRILGSTTISLPSTGETFLGFSSSHVIMVAAFAIHNPIVNECIDNIRFGGFPKDLIFHSGPAEFKKVRGILPVEDFSEATVADGGMQMCDEPINSASDQAGCFSPGDIRPGISFQTVDSLGAGCPTCMIVVGRNSAALGNANPLLAVNPPDSLEITFSGSSTYFAGMGLYSGFMLFSFYDVEGTFLGEGFPRLYGPGDFWGVQSAKPLGRITIAGSPPVIGDVQFGPRFPWPMFMPAIQGKGTDGP